LGYRVGLISRSPPLAKFFAAVDEFPPAMTDQAETQPSTEDGTTQHVSKNKRYRKEKEWDTDDIDHVHSPPIPLDAVRIWTTALVVSS